MARKHVYTVRVVLAHHDAPQHLWIEQLRYMGHLTVLKQTELLVVLEFAPPRGAVDTRTWAEMNAQRMGSFGINAVAAPMWEESGVTNVMDPFVEVTQ